MKERIAALLTYLNSSQALRDEKLYQKCSQLRDAFNRQVLEM